MIKRDLQLIGLARKAGLLAVGSDAATTAARLGKASVILLASDASSGAVKHAIVSAETGGIVCAVMPYLKSELGNITGRGSPGTIAVLDAGLAAEILKAMAQAAPESDNTLAFEHTERFEHKFEHIKAKLHPGADRNSNAAVNRRATK